MLCSSSPSRPETSSFDHSRAAGLCWQPDAPHSLQDQPCYHLLRLPPSPAARLTQPNGTASHASSSPPASKSAEIWSEPGVETGRGLDSTQGPGSYSLGPQHAAGSTARSIAHAQQPADARSRLDAALRLPMSTSSKSLLRDALTSTAVKDKGPPVVDGVLSITPDSPDVVEWRRTALDISETSSSYLEDDEDGRPPCAQHSLPGPPRASGRER